MDTTELDNFLNSLENDTKPVPVEVPTSIDKPTYKMTVSDGKQPVIKYPPYFTKGQITALTNMVAWFTSDDLFYVLEGPAGTGKTTVLKSFIDSIKSANIAITAPTHKAVRIASQMTRLRGHTIQKILGLRPNFNVENFDINNIPFDPLGKKSVGNFMLIIVDEASMINRSLKMYLEREAKTHKTKILYVGDPYQLPPVGEHKSEVFFIANQFKSLLTEVVRQTDNNPITDLLIEIRKSIKNKDYNYIKYMYANPNSIINGHGFQVITSEATFGNYISKAFTDPRLEKNIDWCKYLGYTRNNVMLWNTYIRGAIFPDIKSLLHIDDLIIGHNTIVDDFNEALITNSEDYIINDIVPYRNKYDIEGFNVSFRSVWDGAITPNMFVVDMNNPKSVGRFIFMANKLISDIYSSGKTNKAKWKDYYAFKDQNLLIQDIDKTSDNPTFFAKDIDYGFALTIHKSQGSTFDNVFVNLHNIIYGNTDKPNTNIDFVNRLFYVAASRAKQNLIIFIR